MVRDIFGVIARRRVRSQIWGQGMGRHTEPEIYELGRKDLDALSDFLGDKTWFLGDQPTTLDGLGFGLVANIVWVPIESPLKEHVKTLPNLIAVLLLSGGVVKLTKDYLSREHKPYC